jgi:hypothetical protein
MRHRSFFFHPIRKLYYIMHDAMAALKTQGVEKSGNGVHVWIPEDLTTCVDAWLQVFRPVIVEQAKPHDFLFCTIRGEPRQSLANVVDSVLRRCPHIHTRSTARMLRTAQVCAEYAMDLRSTSFDTVST